MRALAVVAALLAAASAVGQAPPAGTAPPTAPAPDKASEPAPPKPADAPSAKPPAKGKKGKDPKAAVPNIEIPKLPDLPQTSGIKATQGKDVSDPSRNTSRPVEGTTFEVKKVVHARGFSGGGKRACVGRTIYSGFQLDRFPDNVIPFQTCVRVEAPKATRSASTTIQVELVSPSGQQIMEVRDAISVSSSHKAFDYIVSWDGFLARTPGEYKFRVLLGDQSVEFPLLVKGKEVKEAPALPPAPEGTSE
jgi:hypothetical protein